MKIKTEYNIGDVVLFYNKPINENDIGTIRGVSFEFNQDPAIKIIKYKISPARIENSIENNSIEVYDFAVFKKLNKKVFEKMFSEKCAKYVANQHEDKGE